MARRVKDAKLDSREARSKLKPRVHCYWRLIERGLHLGYRRLKGKPGTWWVRHYIGNGSYEVDSIGNADDYSDADGVVVLDFWQAQTKAREQMVQRANQLLGKTGPLTIRLAVEAYLEHLEGKRGEAYDARRRAEAFIYPKLGELTVNVSGEREIKALTAELRRWHTGLASTPPRVRTKAGERQQYRELDDDEEAQRRRRSSANRVLTILKAALNFAWREGHVPNDTAWRRVAPFESVDAARVRYLTIEEGRRLANASDPEFRPLVLGALSTGCRYGELTRLLVSDFNRDAGTLTIRKSKSGKARHVVLTDEAQELFGQWCAGRGGGELIFRRANGKQWEKSAQSRPMSEACERARITPPTGLHGLRHTWASLSVMAGVPLLVVAKNLGHADTRMVEKHYGHLAPSYVADAIRAGAPRFGVQTSNVIAVRA